MDRRLLRSTANPWTTWYRAALCAGDLLAAAAGAGAAYAVHSHTTGGDIGRVDLALAWILPLCWVAVLALGRSYSYRFLGAAGDVRRVFRASVSLTLAVGFVAFVGKLDLAPGYVLLSLGSVLIADLLVRAEAGRRLHAARAAGRYLTPVLVVGTAQAVTEFGALVGRDRRSGMKIVGACLAGTNDVADAGRYLMDVARLGDAGIDVFGDVDTVPSAVARAGAQRVVILAGPVSSQKLRWIQWQLESTDADLVVAPGITEVDRHRLHIQPVAGVPLLHVREPEFTGFRRVVKGSFDRTMAALGLIVLTPVLLVLAMMIKLTSAGPVFFKQVRVGRNGREFNMLKFRSMVVDAEAKLAEMQDQNESDGALFKIREDPRVTRFGRFMRRHSLDELPQLINVLNGTMSLVGPRPPLPPEVCAYEDHVRRRLLVKPGITGLWQVSGRSDLSWEESVRLDLRYVENWSLPLDMELLWKTARAVITGAGAY